MIEEVKKEIINRKDEEQKIRFEIMRLINDDKKDYSLFEKLQETDLKNQQYLKSVINDFAEDLFNVDEMGEDGVLASWLIVQHADNDLHFQVKCLELMKITNCSKKHVAYLTDRIMVNRNDSTDYQEYYTQWRKKTNSDKWYIPADVDWEKVNIKRREANIPFAKEILPSGVYEELLLLGVL